MATRKRWPDAEDALQLLAMFDYLIEEHIVSERLDNKLWLKLNEVHHSAMQLGQMLRRRKIRTPEGLKRYLKRLQKNPNAAPPQ